MQQQDRRAVARLVPLEVGGARHQRGRGSVMAIASATVCAVRRLVPGTPSVPPGASACERPRRCASRSRRSACGTLRSLPVSPISPNATSGAGRQAALGRGDGDGDGEVGGGLVHVDAAGDVDEYVGRAERQLGVALQHGEDHREAVAVDAGGEPPRHLQLARCRPAPAPRAAAAACPRRRRRRPSRAPPRSPRPSSADGSATGASPVDVISNTPISAVEPNRFLTARSTRRSPVRSPSNISTASTRCSSTRGPATAPSLVT